MCRLESRLLERRQPRHCLPCLQGFQGLQSTPRRCNSAAMCAFVARTPSAPTTKLVPTRVREPPSSIAIRKTDGAADRATFSNGVRRLWTTPKMRNPAAATNAAATPANSHGCRDAPNRTTNSSSPNATRSPLFSTCRLMLALLMRVPFDEPTSIRHHSPLASSASRAWRLLDEGLSRSGRMRSLSRLRPMRTRGPENTNS